MESRTDQRDLALLLRIARLATADAEPAECLARILDELLAAFAADSGSIALLNPNTGLLETEVMRGAGAGLPADFALRPGQGVTGWVALHARSRLVADTAAEPRYIAARRGVRCEVAAPLLDDEGRAIGVVDLEADRPGAFTAADLARLEAFAAETSRGLRLLWRLRENRERSAQLETLASLGQALVRRMAEDDLLPALTRSGRSLFGALLCTLHLRDTQAGTLRLHAWDADGGFDARALNPEPVPDALSMLATVVRARRVIEYANLDRTGYHDAADLPRDASLCSALAAPLLIDDHPAGVVTVYTARPHRFTDAQKRLLAALGNFAAVALSNSRLYARVFQTEETLRKNETLTTLGLLAAEIAHEIRNPLTVVKLLHGTLGSDFPAGDPRHRDIAVIAEKLEQLEGIVSRVLSFARPPGTVYARWALHDIVGDTLLLLKAKLAQAGVAVDYPPPGPPLHVDANRGQLQQVLLNVILNALHAMPSGGTLTFRYATLAGEAGGRVQLDIADTGGGIPEGIRPRIFESFLSGRSGGTGLGLTIARRILLDHHGEIALVSTGPHGTTMRITLPLAGPSAA